MRKRLGRWTKNDVTFSHELRDRCWRFLTAVLARHHLSQNHLSPFGSSLFPKSARNLDPVWISAVGYDRHELAGLDAETMLYNVQSSLR
jgi:hypothetical protein